MFILKRRLTHLTLLLSMLLFALLFAANRPVSQAGVLLESKADVAVQPLQIGAPVHIEDIAITYDNPDSWRQVIRYPDAQHIKVHFDTLDLYPGDTLTVSDPEGKLVHTYPGSGTTTDGLKGFYALSIVGEAAVIELHTNASAKAAKHFDGAIIDKFVRGYPQWEIDEVNYGAAGIQSTCGALDRTDASCFADSHPTEYATSEAVARLTFNNGAAQCTAWRVTAGNFVLTNEHCVSSQSALDGMELWFDYERETCGGDVNTPVIVANGDFLIDDVNLDFALFTIDEAAFPSIEQFGYLELDPRMTTAGEEIYIPQHGAGNPREFGVFSDVNTPQTCQIDLALADGFFDDSDVGYLCDTIGGSSGSPVLSRETNRVVALHHFGNGSAPNCSVTDTGTSLNRGVRIELIYPLIQDYIADDYVMSVEPSSVDVCQGDMVMATVSVDTIGSFTDPVTLSVSNGMVSPTVVTPPGTSAYSLDTSAYPAGSATVTIEGDSSTGIKSTSLDVSIYDGSPSAATLNSPANGATGVSVSPTMSWTGGAQSATYDVAIATDPAFSNIVAFGMGLSDTTWASGATLDTLTTYYWIVRANNPCGDAALSGVNSFTTRDVPPYLVVDDDDNAPDVQSTYTAALDAKGLDYDVWDTNNSDDEPTAAEMSSYDMVLWFTGDEFGGFAGPGADGEAALATYLDNGGCLMISSQDYYYDRGLTGFMGSYLGVGSATSDVSQTTVTGQVPAYPDTYSLTYPFTNYSDVITPDGSANLLFSGNNGDAGIYKLADGYATSFWGFPLAAMPQAEVERSVGLFLSACNAFTAQGIDLFAEGE